MCSFYYSQWQSILYHMISRQWIVLMSIEGALDTVECTPSTLQEQPPPSRSTVTWAVRTNLRGGNGQCVQWLDLVFIVFWDSSKFVSRSLPQGSIHVVVCAINIWSRECYQPGEMDKNSPCVEHVIFLWKISKCPSIPGDPEEKRWDQYRSGFGQASGEYWLGKSMTHWTHLKCLCWDTKCIKSLFMCIITIFSTHLVLCSPPAPCALPQA